MGQINLRTLTDEEFYRLLASGDFDHLIDPSIRDRVLALEEKPPLYVNRWNSNGVVETRVTALHQGDAHRIKSRNQ